MRHALQELMDKEVDVAASGTIFTGILREITEQDVVLWTDRGWQSIPHNRINSVRAAKKVRS